MKRLLGEIVICAAREFRTVPRIPPTQITIHQSNNKQGDNFEKNS